MKINRGVMSALLGVAMLAIPITASAHRHDEGQYRGALRPYQAYRPMANFRVAPPMAMTNRFYVPPAAYAPMSPRYYAPYATASAQSCAMAAPYSAYRQPYYQQPYNYMPPGYGAYGAPMGGGLANMIHQRDSAVYLYQLAMQRGNRNRAHHLANDISQLNKNIANARTRSGIGPAYGSFNAPMASSYGNEYRNGGFNSPLASTYGNGYGNSYGYGNSGLGSMMAPLLGGFIH